MPNKLIAALVLLGTALPISAQKFIPRTIQFNGDPEYSTEELLAASGLKKGATLSYADMNDTSKRLMDTGMFASLTFKFDGQDLVFQLAPADQLLPVHLDNLPIVSVTEVDARLHQQFPLYHGKIPPEGGTLEQVRATLEAMLAAQGIKATVVAAPGADSKTRHANSMHFSLTSPPVQVRVNRIDGASSEVGDQLRAIADQAGKLPYDIDHSATDIEGAFAVFYQDRGYAGVKVHAERAGAANVDAAAITVPYTVKIEEGRVYKVGTIHVPEDAPITQDEIAKTLSSPNGPVMGIRVRSIWETIATRNHAKGYLDCKVTPTPQFDDANAMVNYDVAVSSGPIYHLAFVKFENVSDELRALLIKNWQMMPGDPFNQEYASAFLLTAQQNDPVLRRTLANVKATYRVMADPQTHDVNVVLRLEKR